MLKFCRIRSIDEIKDADERAKIEDVDGDMHLYFSIDKVAFARREYVVVYDVTR